jgi:hypothetical protein
VRPEVATFDTKEITMKGYAPTTFRLSFHSISKIQVFILFLLLHLPVGAQETQPEIRQLMIGERTERRVSAEEEDHVYRVEMKRGQVLRGAGHPYRQLALAKLSSNHIVASQGDQQ